MMGQSFRDGLKHQLRHDAHAVAGGDKGENGNIVPESHADLRCDPVFPEQGDDFVVIDPALKYDRLGGNLLKGHGIPCRIGMSRRQDSVERIPVNRIKAKRIGSGSGEKTAVHAPFVDHAGNLGIGAVMDLQ